MGNGWFNLVLTLCAVRGFGRTMGDMKKPSSRGRAWLRRLIFIVFFFAVCYGDEGGDVYVTELGFVTQGEPVVGEIL